MRASLLLFVCIACALVEVIHNRAAAQGNVASSPVVDASGSCPESNAVVSVLTGLLPTNAPGGPPPTATVSDLGGSYIVAIGGRVKRYSDAARDCAERARVAAAFISLALVPDAAADSSATPIDTPAPAPPPAPPTKQPPPPADRWVQVDVRGTGEGAPGSGLFAPGVEMGIAAGSGRVGAQLVCEWVAAASLGAGAVSESGSILIERFPCALGPLLRLSPAASRLEVRTSAGLVVGALRARGTGFSTDYDSVRIELGARVSVDATLHIGRSPGDVSPVVGLAATYDPMTYDLEAMPHGVVAHTPALWAGASAGVSWGIP